mmetsp:Transcript_18252/g.58852  ORF Transcript_18252/g.58852 Transcript_18252/m.58852 type:complete len:263 (+) Transcript_18252:676-1464(+)
MGVETSTCSKSSRKFASSAPSNVLAPPLPPLPLAARRTSMVALTSSTGWMRSRAPDAIIKDATYRKGVKEGFFDATVKRAAIVNTHPTDLPTELWMLFAPLRTLVAKPKRVSGIDDGGVFARKTIVPIETTVSDSSAGTDKLATPTRKSIKKSKKLSPDSSGSAGSSGESGTCGTTSADAFRGFLIQGSEAFMKMPPTGTLQNPPFGVEPTPPPLLVMLAAVVIASSGAKPLLQASPRRAPVLLGATTGPLARLRRWLGGIE